jgi:hypothetical protein
MKLHDTIIQKTTVLRFCYGLSFADRGSCFLRNAGNHLWNYIVSESRRPQYYAKVYHWVYCLLPARSRDSAVGIVTGYWLDNWGVGVRVPVRSRIFSMSSSPVLGPTQPPIQWVRGVVFPRVKRPGRETGHSPRTSAEVKKTWIYTSTPPYAFMA